MSYPLSLKQQAEQLRLQGYSLNEISKLLRIAKSTASYWSKDIILDDLAKLRIEGLQIQGKIRAGLANTRLNEIRRTRKLHEAQDKINAEFADFSLPSSVNKLLCAMLYWAEGRKQSGRLEFINSDPHMIETFLILFRQTFLVNESKFRALVHIHEYHNDVEIKQFWSKITSIPLTQFNKSYLKPHTGINSHPGYKGCIRISYLDSKIALELQSLYNMFARSIIRVW